MSGRGEKYKMANRALVEAIPELREVYESEVAAWGGEEMGSHVVYGTILNPYLDELLQSDEPEAEPVLNRIFAFLEELAADADPYMAEVAITTVAEYLEGDPARLDRARSYMGPQMRRHARTRLPYRVPRRHRQTSLPDEGQADTENEE